MENEERKFNIRLTESETEILAYCLRKGLINAEEDGKDRNKICDLIDRLFTCALVQSERKI